MAEHERIYTAPAVSDAATAKKRFAFNFNGSLLDLERKLNKKEDEMLNRQCSDAPTWSLQCNFRSVVSDNGFHFSANQRKRKAENATDMEEVVKRKRYCIQTGENGIEDLVSSFIPRNQEAELQVHDTDKTFSSCTEPLEGNGRTIDEVESIKMMEKLLRNIRKFNICYTDRKPKARMPFELSQLWSLMSCTKYSFSDDNARVLDQKIVSCLEKSKISHALWKMTKKDLQSVERMAIDHVLGSKSNDLERRLVSMLRNVNRDVGTAGESQPSGVKTQKMKPWPTNHLSQLTWNGGAQRKFRCEHCTYQTDNRSHLLRHQSSIHNMCKPYHCYICTKEFSRVEYIKQHLITAHPGVEYDATRAKNELVFREQFQRQNPEPRKTDDFFGVVRWGQNHTKPKINGGLQEFQSPRNNCSEMQQKFNFFSEDVRKLLCPYCDFAGRDSIEFLQHFERCRPNTSAFRCHVCHESFLGRDYLQVHYANKHFSILYCCDQCPFYTTSLYTYDWHLAQFHFPQSDQNPCPICCRSFGKQSELVHHIEMAHLKQPHCGQNASSSGETSIWHSAREIELNDHHQNIKRVRNVDQWQNGISRNTY